MIRGAYHLAAECFTVNLSLITLSSAIKTIWAVLIGSLWALYFSIKQCGQSHYIHLVHSVWECSCVRNSVSIGLTGATSFHKDKTEFFAHTGSQIRGLVEKVFARSPKGDVAISKLFYIIHSDCFVRRWRTRNDQIGVFQHSPEFGNQNKKIFDYAKAQRAAHLFLTHIIHKLFMCLRNSFSARVIGSNFQQLKN